MNDRRTFLGLAGAALAAGAASGFSVSAAAADPAFPVTKSDTAWRQQLTKDQYAVLRQSATERPFTSALLEEHRRGTFTCAGCNQALFLSKTKFDSGTGWPSFYAPIEHAIGTAGDTSLGMVRNAVHCARCGGHLGHVFDDGPPPTGLRYCINGVALGFEPQSA